MSTWKLGLLVAGLIGLAVLFAAGVNAVFPQAGIDDNYYIADIQDVETGQCVKIVRWRNHMSAVPSYCDDIPQELLINARRLKP